ncbi:MAG: glycogen synthase, partial [Chloroflexi bacterium]|nr:glycogen synthase [Chloroflexota bacterium]
GNSTPLYLIAQPVYFDRENIYGYDDDAQRFLFFCKAALQAVQTLGWQPDVIHCNDWHTGAVPVWLADDNFAGGFFARAATVYTIHNLAYQGVFPASVWDVTGEPPAARGDLVNFMALGIGHAGAITTVSPTYAREILTPQRGEGLHDLLRSRRSHLHGILNGLDVTLFNPATDTALARRFDVDHLEDRAANKYALQKRLALVEGDHFLLGMVSRLAGQKGFDLLIEALPKLLSDTEVQFVLLGAGDAGYAARLTALAHRFPRRVSVNLGYDAILAQHIYAGSDAFLMPSRYEPCGLGQMIALRYGSVPVVRATGGLADTVQAFEASTGKGTGFVFRPYEAGALLDAIRHAQQAFGDRKIWRALQRRGMGADFSWDTSARKYAAVYEETVA